jgi:hypothetical protein
LVQISIKEKKKTGKVLINVQCRLIRFTAVAVEKQFVLINIQAPRFLYIGTGISLLSRERFLYI